MGQCAEFHALKRTVMNCTRAQMVYRWCQYSTPFQSYC